MTVESEHDEFQEHLDDMSVMHKSLMRMIRECCEVMEDIGSAAATFGSGKWTVSFEKSQDSDAAKETETKLLS